jgi:hypothetical protein
VSGSQNGLTTLIFDGRTTEAKAASLRFTTPDQTTLNVPVGTSGFFIVGMKTHASWCQVTHWNPRITILDRNGNELTTTTAPIGQRMVCLSKPPQP